MANYCLVENNKVTDCRDLPKNWKNVSNMHLATNAELKEIGWLPYVEQLAITSTYETIDGTEYKIEADRVVGVEQKRAMTDNEKSAWDNAMATEYIGSRRREYGTWEEQFDMMYHSMDDWKAHCDVIKAKHPKP